MKFFGSQCSWLHHKAIETISYRCGYCHDKVASDRGYAIHDYKLRRQVGGIYICPSCQGATFSAPEGQRFPSSAFGNSVNNVPEDLSSLYEEARRCTSQSCYTSAVLACRKILMNIAVDRGAEKNLPFIEYVNYLSDKGFIPPNGKHWVDHIRKKGNEANHEIELMKESGRCWIEV